ncbi:Yip1 family protein [Gorillibacterium sp. sgz500922]|uniref:Yip1 family protein n=1 Tax=Gorillibacterium sp. sgz500922 TaxID=3446694 RepID=UPI003F6669FB
MARESVKDSFHLMLHPFDGFWDLKYERSRKRNLILSVVILILLGLTNIVRTQYTGFVVQIVYPDSINSLMEFLYVIVPVLFWTVANWSITTLMDGEGKFAEIFISTCFALIPLILINLPLVVLSNYISVQELAFYHFFGNLAVLWSAFLLFVGNMTVQQFTPSKTIGTIVLTLVTMAFLAFLCMLFFSLIQQIAGFVFTLYQEINLRS